MPPNFAVLEKPEHEPVVLVETDVITNVSPTPGVFENALDTVAIPLAQLETVRVWPTFAPEVNCK